MPHKAYKFRIYPTKDQQALIHQTHGHCRFVYNHFLELWNTSYKEEGKGLNRSFMSKALTKMKKQDDTAWLRNVDSVALQASYENLIDAFKRFFNGQNKYPRFKSKKNPIQSYTTKNSHNCIAIVGNQMKLPKLGLMKFAKSRDIEGRIRKATIKYNASGKFYMARLREKVAFWREDFLHKLTTAFIRQYDVICVEDLNTKGMLKNRKLAKAIRDVSWSMFVEKLVYKAKWYGRELVKINRFFPASQLCHVCGHRDGKKPLNVREWTCLSCGTTLDRDINASRNILAEGLRLFEATQP